ncbi:UbiX family flavin prenyltransferase [Candidatus Sumerlaeota bacterium]|nr:UbiX family flavin prenyltransferase [Candidatus Sumerlaeota bacterium]
MTNNPNSEKAPIVVGVTGASGVIYAREFIRELARQRVETHLIVSDHARTVAAAELGVSGEFEQWLSLNESVHACVRLQRFDDVAASCASGTFRIRGMAILPCSMNTLGALAHGIADNLITRAADVCLKERRKLVVCPRETPLSLIHLRNMAALAEAGATIMPCMPGFYHAPETIDDLLQLFTMKLCDQFDLPCSFSHRWLK